LYKKKMKMKALLLLCLCLSSTLAVPATSSLYMGRSSDILIESETQQDSVIFFKGEQFGTTQINKLQDTRFADLFSHVMGTQPFHVDADRTGFPTTSLFNKPRAALLVALESVGSEILSKYPALSFLQNSQMSPISTLSSPANTQTILANLVTGTTPSKHGIVGSSWRKPGTGALVNAYDENGMSFAANIADILLQETQGKSLIVSASSSSSFSSALGAHPEIVSENIGWRAHAYSLSNGAFSTRYSEPSCDQVLAISAEELSALLSDVVISSDVTFSAKNAEDMAFLAELAFVRNLIAKLSTSLSASVKDDMPDMYSFVFASLKGIETKYGKDSNTYAAALSLVDKTISSLISALNQQYDGRVATVIMALNARDISSEALKEKVYNKVSSLLHDSNDFSLHYPALYVRTYEFSGHARDVLCSTLQKSIASSNANVFCATPMVATRAVRSMMGNDANGTCYPPTPAEVAQLEEDTLYVFAFWMHFFMVIIITAFIGWGVYSLAFVGSDASKDSLLFRAAGRHHHQN
jgi:hypothetical protein